MEYLGQRGLYVMCIWFFFLVWYHIEITFL